MIWASQVERSNKNTSLEQQYKLTKASTISQHLTTFRKHTGKHLPYLPQLVQSTSSHTVRLTQISQVPSILEQGEETIWLGHPLLTPVSSYKSQVVTPVHLPGGNSCSSGLGGTSESSFQPASPSRFYSLLINYNYSYTPSCINFQHCKWKRKKKSDL